MFSFSHFKQHPNLLYGFSDRNDGSMHRRLERDNRERYFNSVGIDVSRVVTADSMHGTNVVEVSEDETGTMVAADGLVTNAKNIFLSATGADCFLLYFYSVSGNVIGIAHAGWRGIIGGIVEDVVDKFVVDFGVQPTDVLVGISSGIQRCHFEISETDKSKFDTYSQFVLKRDDRVFVDLLDILRDKLYSKGVSEKHIEDSNICTYCDAQKYFSYRRDKPKEVQPMIGYIGLV